MSDEIRMTLLERSTNSLIEELLMWRGRTAELLDRIAELEAFIGKLIEAGGTMAKGYRCHLYLDERQPINDWMKLEKDWKERKE